MEGFLEIGITTHHAYYMKHLATGFPILPPLRRVGSALASGPLVFYALLLADSQVRGLEPKQGEEAFLNKDQNWWYDKVEVNCYYSRADRAVFN